MVPTLIHTIGEWLDRFSDVVARWEQTLGKVERAYLHSSIDDLQVLCVEGEAIHREIETCKRDRSELLNTAWNMGYEAQTLKELSYQLDGSWPALWTHRITQLELQLNRVQRLSMSLWISAFQSQSIVSEMLLMLATGRTDAATYSPAESRSIEGGFLINEAA